MTSQKAKFIGGIWERFFPEAKKLVDLLREVVGVLQFDELNGAAAQREGRGETPGVLLRELGRQPAEHVVPQGVCQAGDTALGLPRMRCPPTPHLVTGPLLLSGLSSERQVWTTGRR